MAFVLAFAQLGNRADAEDVCQEAFLRCWERIADCREPARVAGWIAAIVRNTAQNRRAYLRLRETVPLESLPAPTGRHPEADAERADLRARLLAALGSLSTVQREVVLLHDLEGWKHAEIGLRLDLSEMMSRRHLSDARKRLRQLLGHLAILEPDHD